MLGCGLRVNAELAPVVGKGAVMFPYMLKNESILQARASQQPILMPLAVGLPVDLADRSKLMSPDRIPIGYLRRSDTSRHKTPVNA